MALSWFTLNIGVTIKKNLKLKPLLMYYALKCNQQNPKAHLKLPGSKSETNRLLILQALLSGLEIENLSDSDDSRLLKKALASERSGNPVIDIGHAGTAMRFLTAYFAFKPGKRKLTGSRRMQSRPIAPLVEALRNMGADIQYEKKEGYPPLLIQGGKAQAHQIEIKADISSQFISALLLIAPTLPKGLQIHLKGKILSRPYIEMTLQLLGQLGIKSTFLGNTLQVFPAEKVPSKTFFVESDWSAASYFYSLAALSTSADFTLQIFREKSLQGDIKTAQIYEQFGVTTHFEDAHIRVQKKKNATIPSAFKADLTPYPDLAQTIAVSCLGLQIPCMLTGLDNLRLKETDRLQALKNELLKFGAEVRIDANTLQLTPPSRLATAVQVNTYEDHRMAMSFAPLAIKTSLSIENPSVVSKSFPMFWQQLLKCGIEPVKSLEQRN